MKRHINKICLIFWCLVFSMQFSCSQKSTIVYSQLTQISPNFNYNYQVVSYDTSYYHLYALEDLRIYEYSMLHENYKNDILISSTKSIKTFVHQKDSAYGFLYNNESNLLEQRMHIDTATPIRKILNTNIENDFKTLKPILISTRKFEKLKEIIELYKVTDLVNPSFSSTWELRYKELTNSYPFSISPYMDSLSRSNLIEIKSENPSRYLPDKNVKIDSFIFDFKLEPIFDFDQERINKIFKKYEQKIGKN